MAELTLHERHLAIPGRGFRLSDIPTKYHDDRSDKKDAQKQIESDQKELVKLQELLYAEGKHAVLIILQAMDTGGKDGVIAHVMGGVNPQGCVVTPFKVPYAGGIGPRLPLARAQGGAAEAHDRYFQPLALRGCAGRAGA